MTTQIQLRRDTAANWTNINPTLALGEPGFETDTNKLKIGDGVHAWADLPYLVSDSGSGNTGEFRFGGSEMYMADGVNQDMILTPNEGASYLVLPGDAAATNGNPAVIGNTGSGGVNIVTGQGIVGIGSADAPTAPTHLHIRNADPTARDFFFGGDDQYLMLGQYGEVIVQSRNNTSAPIILSGGSAQTGTQYSIQNIRYGFNQPTAFSINTSEEFAISQTGGLYDDCTFLASVHPDVVAKIAAGINIAGSTVSGTTLADTYTIYEATQDVDPTKYSILWSHHAGDPTSIPTGTTFNFQLDELFLIITATGHGYSDGQLVRIGSLSTMTWLNGGLYYAKVHDANNIILYTDEGLTEKVVPPNWDSYNNGGGVVYDPGSLSGGDVWLYGGEGADQLGDIEIGGGEIRLYGGYNSTWTIKGDSPMLEMPAGSKIYDDQTVLNIYRPGDDGNGWNAGEIDIRDDGITLWSKWSEGPDAVKWDFDQNGGITFPDGSVQTTAYVSGDNKLWIDTFETVTPVTDQVQCASSVEYDADGNIIALFDHHDTSNNSTYFSVAKFTSTGERIWQVRAAATMATTGWGLAVDNQGGYVYIAGHENSGSYDISSLIKLDGSNGNIIWSMNYDFGYASSSPVVDVASDGNPVLVGYASNGVDNYTTTLKVDATDGSIIWSRGINGQANEEAYGMAVGPEGEIVVVGYMDHLEPANSIDTLYSVPSSNPNWTVPEGVSAGSTGFSVSFVDGVPTFFNITDTAGGHSVDDDVVTVSGTAFGGTTPADDMTVKVGSVRNSDASTRMLVAKYNSAGVLQWKKAVLFDAEYGCYGADADIDSNGNIYVCGQYNIPGSGSAMSLFKMDTNGNKQWSRRVVGDCDTFATSIVVGPDNCLYLSGVTGINATSDFQSVIAKYDESGNILWQRVLDNINDWSFGGTFFIGNGGGSNLAVTSGYVALSGGFGNLFTNVFHATVTQVDVYGTMFAVDDWDYKAANFTGSLNPSASDIDVRDASAKTDQDLSETVTATSVNYMYDNSIFLIGTLHAHGGGTDSGNSQWVSPNNNVWYIRTYNGGFAGSYNGSDPLRWFDRTHVPTTNGANVDQVRGAIVEYHAYINGNYSGTIVGTIHWARDYGETMEVPHTEHVSGQTALSNAIFWHCDANGLYFKDPTGQTVNIMVQWTAKVFYGSELAC